jgi:cephalosporin-C deacetylase-like acetyl esterase
LKLTRRSLFLIGLVLFSLPLSKGGYAQQAAPAVMMDAGELFNYDRSLPLAPEEVAGPDATGYKSYKISYSSSNNQRVPAVFVVPSGKEGQKLPCIILMHGLDQNKTALAILWGNFTNAGYAIFSIDAQYHGDRKPKMPLELFGSAVYSTRELLIQTVIDLRRGIDYLQTRPEVDPKKIGYVGLSMGGILGSITAAVDNRIQAPVLALAGGNWKLMFEASKLSAAVKARENLAASGINPFAVLDPVDPIHWVGRISPRPILFINGDADTTVPVVAGRALHAAAGDNKEVFIYKGEHVPAGAEMFKVIGKINQWLDAHLK